MQNRKTIKDQPAIIVGACRFRTQKAAQIARDNHAKFKAAMTEKGDTPAAKAEAFAAFFNIRA